MESPLETKTPVANGLLVISSTDELTARAKPKKEKKMIGKIIAMKKEQAQVVKENNLEKYNWAGEVKFETLPYVEPVRTNKAK